MQAHPHRLLLGGAQRKEDRERADRQGESQYRCPRHLSGHDDRERKATDRSRHPLLTIPGRGEAAQIVGGQRSPDHGCRREGSEQEVGDGHHDRPAAPVGKRAHPADSHGTEQPDHDDRVRLHGEQGQQDTAAQQHALVHQYLHASIIDDRRRFQARQTDLATLLTNLMTEVMAARPGHDGRHF